MFIKMLKSKIFLMNNTTTLQSKSDLSFEKNQ